MGTILSNKYNMQKLWQTNLHCGRKNSQQRHEKNDTILHSWKQMTAKKRHQ